MSTEATGVTALDPLHFPLYGTRLIEASAGTGKTFTIALLYVRLVLGPRHDADEAAFSRPLMPPEILVVTFTNAATEELRERIRTRLVEAARVFLGEGDAAADPLLLALRDDYPASRWAACARRLQLAAEWMDEAAVSTIHGWCYRMLREHAFDSGSLFALNLENDQSELEAEVVRDYWRSFYYALNADELAGVTRHWQSPDELHARVRSLLGACDALDASADSPRETLTRTRAEVEARLAELKAPWVKWVEELQALFEDAAEKKAFKGQSFNKNSRANWLGALRDWCHGDAIWPALTPAAWKRLTPEGMAEIWQKGEPPRHWGLMALKQLPDQLDALPTPRADLLAHAVHWCRARLDREQGRRAEMGPNELLTHLDRALAGANCEALGTQIRRQFPVAMVDEFQDTDPVQYRIFDCVYRIRENRPEMGLFLIGDPKQAIYAFRGADIHTYLQARRATQGRHVTLGTNFRATRPMVEAVNRYFAVAEAHPPGAFLFKEGDVNPVPFQSVSAKGRKDSLTLDGKPLPALTLWHLDAEEPLGKGAYQKEMAERCASAMAALLEQGQCGRAGFMDSGRTGLSQDADFTPISPADLAVLVNDGREARAIRQALARRGVKSVYLSDKDKVFASPMASQLEAWLRACAEPDDARLLHTALAMPALGLDIAALERLNADELAWEDRVLQFRDYRRLWQRQGVLPLVRRLMTDFEVPARLLAGGPASDGERCLTDLLHLGELLQQASQELDGEHAVIRFLAETRAEPDSADDAHKLRLESDADLVQVVTVHKSKGLEYPLVFLPFICNHRPTKPDDSPLRWHDEDGRLHIALEPDEDTLALADRERLGEDLRKLYVALTRSRHATFLGLAPLKNQESSAIGQLLANGEPLTPAVFAQSLVDLCGNAGGIHLTPAPAMDQHAVSLATRDAPLGDALTPSRIAREHWWIASYSALRFAGTAEAAPIDPALALPEPATPQEATAYETLDEPRDSATAEPTAPSLHRFPRGPGPGTFLHGLLEWVGQQGFATLAEQPDLLEDTLARRCNLRGWRQWIPTLQEWLLTLLDTPLLLPPSPPGGDTTLRLAELSSYRVELEFWFAAHQTDTERLDALVRRFTLAGAARPRAERDRLNGMLKGFIDLVFELEGRYYVLDWKSNHLGPDDDAYTAQAMIKTVADKRYDLQYALYLLALHRLLKARLPDYDYDRHVGGSLTVFLRGFRAPSRGVHVERPPRELIEALDALFQGTDLAHPAPETVS